MPAPFAFFWCTAVLLHQLYLGRLLVLDATAPLTFAALFALCRPASTPRMCLLAAVQLAVVAMEMPRVSNHWLMMGVTCIGLLVALLPSLIRRGPAKPDPEAVLGPVRVSLIVVYGFTAFHKLNAGFLDPAVSCGAEHYRRLADSVPLLPRAPWALWSAILGTLAIEAALPLLLLFKTTRAAAFALGWVFHLVLGWNGYWDFSSVAAAYFAAFLPARSLARLRDATAQTPVLRRIAAGATALGRARATFPSAAALLGCALLAPLVLDAEPKSLILAANRAGRLVWLVWWLTSGALLALAWLGSRGPAPAPAAPAPVGPWWRRPVLWVAPLLLALDGCSPYLGLKSESSYAMFSNLQTEGSHWNHRLVPRSARVLPYADELVRILRSSDATLSRLARGGYELVPLELRRYVAHHPEISMVYARGGRVIHAPHASADPFLGRPLSFVERKLVLFRPVSPRNACLH